MQFQVQNSTGKNVFLVCIIGIVVLVLIGILAPSNQPSRSVSSATSAPVVSPKALALKNTELQSFDWNKASISSVMEADFVIRNNGHVAVKDVVIKCVHFAPSGTQIDSNERTIYEVFEPGKVRAINDFNMGFMHSQAEKTSCRIVDLKI